MDINGWSYWIENTERIKSELISNKANITPEDIEDKLQFIDCGCIFCNGEQRGAVELISEDVGLINDSENTTAICKDTFSAIILFTLFSISF